MIFKSSAHSSFVMHCPHLAVPFYGGMLSAYTILLLFCRTCFPVTSRELLKKQYNFLFTGHGFGNLVGSFRSLYHLVVRCVCVPPDLHAQRAVGCICQRMKLVERAQATRLGWMDG